MASVIPDYDERIRDLLATLGLRSTAVETVLLKIARLRQGGLDVHPTYNFKVTRGNMPLFLRVLAPMSPGGDALVG